VSGASKSRVRQPDIQIGQALRWDVYDGAGVLLLRKGQVVGSATQLERLIGAGVYADTAALTRSRNDAEAPPPGQVSALRQLMVARKRLDLLFGSLASMMENGTFIPQVMDIVRQIDLACTTEPNVAVAVILLRQEGRYATRHMVDVAIVIRLVARTMNLPRAQEDALVAAALTMNLSMVDLQDALKDQNGALTPAQREQLERHPSETCSMLAAAGVTDKVWLRSIAEHHEHVDGSGYPAKLKREALGPGGQLLCLADVFCARVTPAVYRPAVASNMALRSILLERGKSFDPVLAGQFIKTLGVFPPGLLVRLANGEIGIVAKMGETPNYPLVASIIGAQGVPLTIALRRDTNQDGYRIVETVDPKSFSTYVNMESIWGAAASMN